MSSAFEYPEKIVKILFREGLDVNQAFFEAGLTKNKKIGSFEGAVGILTKGRWQRADTVKQSIISALVALDNKELYSSNLKS
jgi:non-canonical (house-cleaning) NTP pyrophosphatase